MSEERSLNFIEHIIEDDLKYLGNLVNESNANIIKLPNISASIPQIKNAIKELQHLGYNIPEYPDDPENNSEKEKRPQEIA